MEGTEDCLNLNVFTKKVIQDILYEYCFTIIIISQLPDGNSKLKPVVFYIHGGRFQHGSNSTDLYGPHFLLLQDIVLVVPNYRLGIMGFLSLEDPALDIPGNAGLKDQNLALQWVHKNIEQFNGDPNNVTIFGHSAGSMCTHYHVLSPCSRGLFQKAILLSGSVFWTWAERTEFSLKNYADILNMKSENEADILEVMKTLPAETLIEAQDKYLSVSILTDKKGKYLRYLTMNTM